MAVTDKKYDVIISEPSNPWISGIGSLFTKEYYELAGSKLKEHTDPTLDPIHREIVRLTMAAYLSAEEGRVVDLTDPGTDVMLAGYVPLIQQGRGAEVLGCGWSGL